MVRLLRHAGISVVEGRLSLRLDEMDHFVFREYGGDLGGPVVEADGEPDSLLRDAGLLSDALRGAGVVHRFEVYDAADRMIGYLHHDWPVA